MGHYTIKYDFGEYEISYDEGCQAIAEMVAQEMINEENAVKGRKPYQYDFKSAVNAIERAIGTTGIIDKIFDDYEEYLKEYFEKDARVYCGDDGDPYEDARNYYNRTRI